MCFQNSSCKKSYIIVVYIGTEAGNKHYSHIVIDILKGTCKIIMDPRSNAQMDCIYFEVCNCIGSGAAGIMYQMYLHSHLYLNPHRWFSMLDSKALLADSQ